MTQFKRLCEELNGNLFSKHCGLNDTINSSLRMDLYLKPNVENSKLISFAKKIIFNLNPEHLLKFYGGYKSSGAHIDKSMDGYNFYYLKKGKKKVYLIPPEFTSYVSLDYGVDNQYVIDEKNDHSNMNWLKNIPSYYKFYINQNDILIFNNSGMIHKFINCTGNEIAYSLRFRNSNTVSPLTYYNIINSDQRYFKDIIFYYLNGSVARASDLIPDHMQEDLLKKIYLVHVHALDLPAE